MMLKDQYALRVDTGSLERVSLLMLDDGELYHTENVDQALKFRTFESARDWAKEHMPKFGFDPFDA